LLTLLSFLLGAYLRLDTGEIRFPSGLILGPDRVARCRAQHAMVIDCYTTEPPAVLHLSSVGDFTAISLEAGEAEECTLEIRFALLQRVHDRAEVAVV